MSRYIPLAVSLLVLAAVMALQVYCLVIHAALGYLIMGVILLALAGAGVGAQIYALGQQNPRD